MHLECDKVYAQDKLPGICRPTEVLDKSNGHKTKILHFFIFIFQNHEFQLITPTISDEDENFCLAQKITFIYGQHHPLNSFF